MNKRILLRIDFQNDFVHPQGNLTIADEELIDRHQKFANNLFNNSFDEIIDSYDTHFEDTYPNTNEAQNFPIHCVYGTWGWQQAAPFKDGLDVKKIYKSTTNIWNETKAYFNSLFGRGASSYHHDINRTSDIFPSLLLRSHSRDGS